MPVFVLTHHARDPLPMQGGTTFMFVTTGIESALEQARSAAGGKDVAIAGGARTVQQYMAAGLLDAPTGPWQDGSRRHSPTGPRQA